MTAPNGQDTGASTSVIPPTASPMAAPTQFSPEIVKALVAQLEVPFDPLQIEWRVMNTTKKGQPMRGQVVPYADQRAYTDRLNALFTPAGWTRKYSIHTSATFERTRDQKIVAKVLVTCELTIFGLGSHSATGEEWSDNDNAATAAEAQAFKRACACFGLGRYLYYFTGTWVELDERKRPRTVPQLAGWATPAGWIQGLRPSCAAEQGKSQGTRAGNGSRVVQNGNGAAADGSVVREIERMERVVGKRMYRGVLKGVARMWNPRGIQSVDIQNKVLAHMQAAERGLRRLQLAREKIGPVRLASVLRSLNLRQVEDVDSLETLRALVAAIEMDVTVEH